MSDNHAYAYFIPVQWGEAREAVIAKYNGIVIFDWYSKNKRVHRQKYAFLVGRHLIRRYDLCIEMWKFLITLVDKSSLR